MRVVPWGRTVVLGVVVASTVVLGRVLEARHCSPSCPPPLPGKFGFIIWLVGVVLSDPVIGIPVLAVLIIVFAYVWKLQYGGKRRYDGGDPHSTTPA